jgi:hypothetical protein
MVDPFGQKRQALRRLYQIPEPGGNHTKTFTDIRAFYLN